MFEEKYYRNLNGGISSSFWYAWDGYR
jgi:hypothetical protein